jgi:asparagine synthetase B (glutamine-hydrolysing)
MPMPGSSWDPAGRAESIYHRYLAGTSTIVQGVSRLPHGFRLGLAPGSRRVSLTPLPPRHQQPIVARPAQYREIVEATCSALTQAVADASEHYDNVAIFLSGGVDSSLLAALARLYFKRCLLVTPVFPGHDNPELDTAKAFASILKVEHLLVPIDETRLEHDLRQLTWQKGSQITFQLLAVQQMLAAIPKIQEKKE